MLLAVRLQESRYLLLLVKFDMKKSGQIWISAVLYIALGVVAISIVLSAGVPIINKIKDKNTIVQTKEILFTLDNIIREVRDEGPGSRRVIQPFIIKDGNLFIDSSNNKIIWELQTATVFVELCGRTKTECEDNELIVKEGPLQIYETTTIVEDENIVHLELSYKDVGFLDVISDAGRNSPLIGRYSVTIENAGIDPAKNTNLPDIEIKAV